MQILADVPLWTDACAVYPYSEGMEAAFTFVSTYGDVVKMGVKNGNHILLPRRCAPSLGIDKRRSHPVGPVGCKYPPLDGEQAGVIEQSLSLLLSDVDHVVEAPTGFGKTYVGSAIAAALGQTTLIVVPKQDLMDSWYNTLVNLIGINPNEIGKAQASKLDYKGKRFVLGMVQSLIRPGKYDSEFFDYFGLVIFDETHRMAAESFSTACTLFPAKHRLGLSATPKRTDGKTPVVTAHIGPVMVRGTTVPMKPKILVEQTGWSVPGWMTSLDPGRMMPAYGAMAKDLKRNQHIAKFAISAYTAGRSGIVLMSDLTAHLQTMESLLISSGIPASDIGMYRGDTQKLMLKPNANKRIVLATYGMCAEGTDYPQWDTLCMMTPRANVKQPLGRILRRKQGKRTPLALDLVDKGSIFKGFYYKRLKTFHEVGGEVVELK